MNRMSILIIFSLFLSISVCSAEEKPLLSGKTKTYHSAKFGFTAKMPVELKPKEELDALWFRLEKTPMAQVMVSSEVVDPNRDTLEKRKELYQHTVGKANVKPATFKDGQGFWYDDVSPHDRSSLGFVVIGQKKKYHVVLSYPTGSKPHYKKIFDQILKSFQIL